MTSKFEIYLNVKFTHSYYETSVYNGISVFIDNNTKATMINHGLILKYVENGFIILFDKFHAGDNRTRKDIEKYNLNLRFSLTLKDRAFYNYTLIKTIHLNQLERKEILILLNKDITLFKMQLRSDITKSHFSFNNYSENPTIFNDGYTLHKHLFANKNDYLNRCDFLKETFGEINLKINSNTKNIYYIRFETKRTHWHYILASPFFNDIINPVVIDEDGLEEFSIPVIINILKRDIITITSKNPLLLSQYPKYKFKLVQDFNINTGKYKVLKSILGVADINRISNACAQINDKGLEYSEIFI